MLAAPHHLMLYRRNRLDPWPRCRHSREGGNPVYFGLHGYTKSVWIPAFAGMTVAGSKRLRIGNNKKMVFHLIKAQSNMAE